MTDFFISLRLFAAFMFVLFGIGIVFKAKSDSEILLGAVLGAIGLTFLALLVARIKRN